LFAAAAAILSAVVFGALPAASMARADLALVLNQGGRAGIGGANQLRSGLVASEVALAVVLCTAAGLMVKTVWARRLNPNYLFGAACPFLGQCEIRS
jgi:putative ABC transport system permease protein